MDLGMIEVDRWSSGDRGRDAERQVTRVESSNKVEREAIT